MNNTTDLNKIEGATYANDFKNRYWVVGTRSNGTRYVIWTGKTLKGAENKRARMTFAKHYEIIDRGER